MVEITVSYIKGRKWNYYPRIRCIRKKSVVVFFSLNFEVRKISISFIFLWYCMCTLRWSENWSIWNIFINCARKLELVNITHCNQFKNKFSTVVLLKGIYFPLLKCQLHVSRSFTLKRGWPIQYVLQYTISFVICNITNTL